MPLLPLNKIEPLLNEVYFGVDGYKIMDEAKKNLIVEDASLTYGEVTLNAMQQILDVVNPQPGEVFYDLGCGIGKAVLLAALMGEFSKVAGVEIVPEIYTAAEEARKKFIIKLEQKQVSLPAKISIINNDIFEADFSDADTVFVATTCFTDLMMGMLRRRLTMLKPGSKVITMTRTLQSPTFEMISYFTCPMNWGEATLFVYKKK